MSRSTVFIVLLAVTASCVPLGTPGGSPPTDEERKARLVSAGISDATAAGIVAIEEKYEDQIAAAKGNPDEAKTAFDAIKAETDTYIKTQPSADQTAYEAFVQKMDAHRDAHHNPHSDQ